jgi:hypothetical protein
LISINASSAHAQYCAVWVSRLAARQEGRLDLARADDEKAASLATPEDWQNVRWSERDRLMGRAMNRRTLILWAGKLDRDYARVRPRAITGQAFPWWASWKDIPEVVVISTADDDRLSAVREAASGV